MSKIFTVTLPDIGEGVVEGEIIEWLKNEGDPLSQDEAVVVVMTDKATVELPAPYPGKLSRQYYQVGEISIKDQPLYDIQLSDHVAKMLTVAQKVSPNGNGSATANKTAAAKKPVPPPKNTPKAKLPPVARPDGQKALAAPTTRKLARDLGVDINSVPASGRGGLVSSEDIRKFVAGSGGPTHPTTPTPYFDGDEVKPLQGIRALVAQKMTESKTIIPHFSFFDSANARYLIQLRNNLKGEAQKRGLKLTFLPFFIRALSLCLKEFPQFNASVDLQKNALVIHKPHNIGIAMKTNYGLIVPVLKDVQNKSLEKIITGYNELREKAWTNKLKPEDMKDSTITISNFGTEGGLWATPVINYPEVAILATAKIQKQPVVRKDEVVIRDILNCSWSFDHRIIDGDMAASFSKAFIKLIENPIRIL
ncbi:MAG: pyruvate dehydrogenase E2 component (dihydrolipoamide acetyltransferase) [Chlamydiales bacterium]|jgi:pyruvate dehydrogenase E2 component (dihydrolipoamide acetyltransferase)